MAKVMRSADWIDSRDAPGPLPREPRAQYGGAGLRDGTRHRTAMRVDPFHEGVPCAIAWIGGATRVVLDLNERIFKFAASNATP